MRRLIPVAVLAGVVIASGAWQSHGSAAEPPITLGGTLRVGEPGVAAFTRSYPAPLLRTWDVADWGTYQPPGVPARQSGR